MRELFQNEDSDAILLIDASNAFYSLNHLTALHYITCLCPSLATVLINTYRAPTDLFVDGEVIYSLEGTTQGDPLAMPMYALATIPLLKRLRSLTGIVASMAMLNRFGMEMMLLLQGNSQDYTNGGHI